MKKAVQNKITHAGSRETGESSLRPPFVCGGGCDRSVGSQSLRKPETETASNAQPGHDSRASTPSALSEARVVLERTPTPDSTPAPSADDASPGPNAQRKTRRTGPSLASSSDEASSLRTVRSMESVTSLPEGKLWRKRKPVSLSEPSSDDEDRASGTTRGSPVLRARAKRGRGRPPTTGEYVGLAKAKAELNRAMREELMLQAEKEVAESAKRVFSLRGSVTESELARTDSGSEPGPETVADLYQKAKDAAAIIENVACKSGRLKGTFVRALKDSTKLIVEVLDVLRATSANDETRNLQAQNTRLQKALDDQQKEIETLRLEMRQVRNSLGASKDGTQPAPAPATLTETPASEGLRPEPALQVARAKPAKRTNPPLPESSRATSDKDGDLAAQIISQVGFMIDAKLAGLEDRLLPPKVLRPPLAADRKNAQSYAAAAKTSAGSARSPAAVVARMATAATAGTTRASPLVAPRGPAAVDSGQTSAPSKKRKRGPRGRRSKAGNGGQGEARPLPSRSAGDGWTVVGKGRKKKAAPVQPPQRPKAPKLRTPRTAAVVMQLQPAAAETGATYADILREAKSKVDLQSLGISNLRIRKAVTGARVLELAGASSTEKADTLAEKLRESLSGDVVKVSRPIKCAQMRVMGLDDSVTAQEVVEAVAKAGGCAVDAIKAGAIREGASGMGSLLVSCPIAAAKKVAQGRLLVGWTSARVRVLEPRPLRCFRCHEVGHTHALCESEVDRSTQCFRCGQTGHQSSTCSATPHCTVCEAARRPAEHRLGSSQCTAQSKTKRKVRKGPQAPLRPSHPQAAGRAGTEPMNTN
ncbi:uncharacterized protein LOC126380821 [Pectinophora gossypiella]|uniref:uncharacterized protein LOC126373497 n=1 Tax=Pectinophora gossypiella TaxID=13191 RepID=UPI00214E6B04|nr:uncharacterized protein LOC126373497 [Pectinophora gossypiella]XP_049886373.1 uncharacterized protein LOC126380821 [Pectinophora gossypiella]